LSGIATPIASRRDAMGVRDRMQAVNDLPTINRPYGTKRAEQLQTEKQKVS